MATASFACGIISALTFATVVLPMFFGSLSILFGHLSKTEEYPFPQAKWGSRMGLASIVIMLALGTTAFVRFSSDERYRENLEETFQSAYGITFEEYQSVIKDVLDDGEVSFEHEIMLHNMLENRY